MITIPLTRYQQERSGLETWENSQLGVKIEEVFQVHCGKGKGVKSLPKPSLLPSSEVKDFYFCRKSNTFILSTSGHKWTSNEDKDKKKKIYLLPLGMNRKHFEPRSFRDLLQEDYISTEKVPSQDLDQMPTLKWTAAEPEKQTNSSVSSPSFPAD